MGEQSTARHRHRRRHRLDDDAQRLGSNLARPEEDHQVDRRQRRQWYRNSRESKVPGEADFPDVPRQLFLVVPTPVSHGSLKPLSYVWQIVFANDVWEMVLRK